MRKRNIVPEEIFYNGIYSFINNLLIDNPNYTNNQYFDNGISDLSNTRKLIEDTKGRAKYILERVKETKHLIDDTFKQ